MNDKSEKQAERLMIIAVIVIFLLLLLLSSSEGYSRYTLSSPVSAESVHGEGQQGNESGSIQVSEVSPLITSETVTTKTSPETKESRLHPGETLAAVPYNLGSAETRNLKVSVHVSNQAADAASSNIRLEIPLLGDLDSPYQVTLKESFSHEAVELKESDLGNRIAVFQITSLAPGAKEIITLNYNVNVHPMTSNSSYKPYEAGSAAAVYLQPAQKIESDHPEIISQARQLTAGLTDEREKALAIFKFVIAHLKYDLNSASRNKGALNALNSRSGVCEDYASLFVALCRASGIPARVVNGYTDPKGRGEIWNLSAGETVSLSGYRHSWAEFYLEETGWLPADPTMNIYSNTLTYFGSLPQASHLAQNYLDQSIRARFQGGQLAVSWNEELAG